ncbi:MAG: immunoglobulin-like domain-containing protein [Bacilli bacterium]
MANKGFTLIEILAVVTIIGVVSLITMPVVQKNITKSRQQAYNNQIDNIVKAAKDWSSENLTNLPENNNEKLNISLEMLMSLGYLEDNLVDPLTDKYFSPDTVITIEKINNNYQYKVNVEFDKEKVEVDHDAPVLFLNGDYLVYVEINTLYNELGISCPDLPDLNYFTFYYDNNNQEIDQINVNKLGNYVVKYMASNDGKQSSITRHVVVRDTIAPVITVPITETINVSTATNYDLKADVSVTDNSGEKLEVGVVGQLSSIPGKYVITYRAVDSSGNERIKKRTIIVEE